MIEQLPSTDEDFDRALGIPSEAECSVCECSDSVANLTLWQPAPCGEVAPPSFWVLCRDCVNGLRAAQVESLRDLLSEDEVREWVMSTLAKGALWNDLDRDRCAAQLAQVIEFDKAVRTARGET